MEFDDLKKDLTPIAPIELKFRYYYWQGNNKQSIQVTRRQFPLVPAFAITAHNAQGKTLSKAVVDISKPPSKFDSQAVYVALSRFKTRSGLAILRDFDFAMLTTNHQMNFLKHLEQLAESITQRHFS